MASRRTERVGSLIRSIVADAIHARLSDPRIHPITSITRVEVSADFSVARIFVSVMAEESRRKLCLVALESASGRLRRLLGPELRLRKIPMLEFKLDDSLRRASETVETIDRAMRELGEEPDWLREDDDATAPGESLPHAAGDECDTAAQEDT